MRPQAAAAAPPGGRGRSGAGATLRLQTPLSATAPEPSTGGWRREACRRHGKELSNLSRRGEGSGAAGCVEGVNEHQYGKHTSGGIFALEKAKIYFKRA